MNKYLKANSLTWWASALPLACGIIIIAAKGFPSLAPVAEIASALGGGLDPATMINLGLIGIGLRSAIK